MSDGARYRGCRLCCGRRSRQWRAKERSVAVNCKRLLFALDVRRGAQVPTIQSLSMQAGWIKGSGHDDFTRETACAPWSKAQAVSV